MRLPELDYSDMKRIALEAAVIICCGLLLGLAFNYRLVSGVFEGEVAPVPHADESSVTLPQPATLEDVRDAGPETLVVDARSPEQFRAAHLPNAVSLPLALVEEELDAFMAAVPKDRRLIVYCNGYGCPDSFDLAAVLLRRGYREVLVFEGGIPQWHDAGLPLEGGE